MGDHRGLTLTDILSYGHGATSTDQMFADELTKGVSRLARSRSFYQVNYLLISALWLAD